MAEHPTKFAESNALLAMQDGDEELARESLETMLPGELRRLASACVRLEEVALQVKARKQEEKDG